MTKLYSEIQTYWNEKKIGEFRNSVIYVIYNLIKNFNGGYICFPSIESDDEQIIINPNNYDETICACRNSNGKTIVITNHQEYTIDALSDQNLYDMFIYLKYIHR